MAARLVAIGDSMTQGFQSLAITHTDLSMPALVADRMGLGMQDFRLPDFKGSGGLPLNLEWLARQLERAWGSDVRFFEWIGATFQIVDLIDQAEDYWERGRGSVPIAPSLYHNLAVWGFEAGDSYQLHAGLCEDRLKETKDNWFSPPSAPRHRTALRVLNPSRDPALDGNTQIGVAKQIAAVEGGIDHLILALGSNNCLGTVVSLDINETGDDPPGPDSGHTLWKPDAFQKEYLELADHIAAIGTTHVHVANVPHVTIPPITRGIMRNKRDLPRSRTYFDYYARFWIRDEDFDPDHDDFLSRNEARLIDQYIDEYNEVIKDVAASNGWHLVDICQLLDDLAVRRNYGEPKADLPAPIADLSVSFFEIRPDGSIKQGGLISLDGVHPTTCGYGLMAREFINSINGAEPGACRDLDFAGLRRWDSLVSHPPRTLDDIYGMLQFLEKRFHMSRWFAK